MAVVFFKITTGQKQPSPGTGSEGEGGERAAPEGQNELGYFDRWIDATNTCLGDTSEHRKQVFDAFHGAAFMAVTLKAEGPQVLTPGVERCGAGGSDCVGDGLTDTTDQISGKSN